MRGYEWTNGQTDKWFDGRMDGWMIEYGWMDK